MNDAICPDGWHKWSECWSAWGVSYGPKDKHIIVPCENCSEVQYVKAGGQEMKIKKYDLWTKEDYGHPEIEEHECPQGPWVKAEDAEEMHKDLRDLARCWFSTEFPSDLPDGFINKILAKYREKR